MCRDKWRVICSPPSFAIAELGRIRQLTRIFVGTREPRAAYGIGGDDCHEAALCALEHDRSLAKLISRRNSDLDERISIQNYVGIVKFYIQILARLAP